MTMTLTGRLRADELPLEALCLDANNPRFGSGFVSDERIADAEIAQSSVQNSIIDKFENAEETTFKVDDLRDSIKAVGFIPIDQVVVRELVGVPGKYVVIEGNRRICSCKLVVREHDEKVKNDQTVTPHEKEVRERLHKVYVQVLDTQGLNPSEVLDLEAIIVGLRHFGAVAQWDAYAKARHVFAQYLSPGDGHDVWTAEEMRLENKRLALVAGTFSSSKKSVEKQLKAIVAYRQVAKISGIKPKHFSLLREFVTGRNLALYVINIDPSTFRLDEESVAKLVRVCQFDDRDQYLQDDKDRPPKSRLTILNDPKSVGRLNKLAGYLKSTWPPSVRQVARESIDNIMMGLEQDETGGLKQSITLDVALDNTIDQNRSIVWVEKLREQLEILDESIDGEPVLSTNDFSGIGSDLELYEKLKKEAGLLNVMLAHLSP